MEHISSSGLRQVWSAAVAWQASDQILWPLSYPLADGIPGTLLVYLSFITLICMTWVRLFDHQSALLCCHFDLLTEWQLSLCMLIFTALRCTAVNIIICCAFTVWFHIRFNGFITFSTTMYVLFCSTVVLFVLLLIAMSCHCSVRVRLSH